MLKSLKRILFIAIYATVQFAGAQHTSLIFDGTNDAVALNSKIFTDGIQNFTIELWIKAGSGLYSAQGTNWAGIVGAQNGGSVTRNPSIFINRGDLHVDMRDANNNTTQYAIFTSGLGLSEETWYHIALVKNGTKQILYVNASAVDSSTAPTGAQIDNNFVLGLVGGSANYFRGELDNVRFWNVVRTPAQIATYTRRNPHTDESGLLAAYELDEGTGTSVTNNCSNVTPVTGTINGAVWGNGSLGWFANNAMSFDGVNDYLYGNLTTVNTSSVTIECWVKLSSLNIQQNIIALRDEITGSQPRIVPYITSGNNLAFYSTNGTLDSRFTTTVSLSANVWYHVAFVITNSKMKVYCQSSNTSFMDSLVTTINTATLDGSDYLSIGADATNVGAGLYANAVIDNVRIWSTERTQSEILENRFKVLDPSTSNLICQYTFNYGLASSSNTTLGSVIYDDRLRNPLTITNMGMTSSSSNLIAQDTLVPHVLHWYGDADSDVSDPLNFSERMSSIKGSYFIVDATSKTTPVLNGSTYFNALEISSGKKFDINGKLLQVYGNISGTGTIKGSTSSKLKIGRTPAPTNLYFDQASSGTSSALHTLDLGDILSEITLQNELKLYNRIVLNSGNFNANGNLVFKSNSSGTAIAQISDDARYGFTGNVEVESYFPAKRAFRLVSSPVNSTGTIYSNWQESGSNSAGFGTHITGDGSNGTDATSAGNASLFTFDNSNQSWSAISSTNNTTNDKITAGKPYRIMIRGDRTINLNSNTPTPSNTILRTTGTLNLTDVTTSMPSGTVANTDVLVGNPFQAPVDISQVMSSTFFNVNMKSDIMYIWDPNINTRGAYVTVSLPNGTNSLGSEAGKYLMPGQSAFFKTKNNGAASITMPLIYTAMVARNATFREENTESELIIQLYQKDTFLKGGSVCDGVSLKFSDAYDSEYNSEDATKAFNLDENLGVKDKANQWYSIDKRYLPIYEDSIFLGINKYRHTSYTLYIKGNNYNGITPYLMDRFTQERIPVDAQNGTLYTFEVSDNVSKLEERFILVFNELQFVRPVNELQLKIFPNPNQGDFQIELPHGLSIEDLVLTDLLGRKIPIKKVQLQDRIYEIHTSSILQSGHYLLKIANFSTQLSVLK